MSTDPVPHSAIPDLASRVSADMLDVLQRIQKAGFIRNGEHADEKLAHQLHQLAELGLVDPVYADDQRERPHVWVSNLNGSRVLTYRTGIRSGPHYELPSAELAAWLEEQGADRWWSVDGDPLLTGRLSLPCPADELAAELRKIARPLLVQAKKDNLAAKGQIIGKDQINTVVGRFADGLPGEHAAHPGGADRILGLCWKGSTDEWLLIEDSETTNQMAQEMAWLAEDAKADKE